jgi:hypothetical protein
MRLILSYGAKNVFFRRLLGKMTIDDGRSRENFLIAGGTSLLPGSGPAGHLLDGRKQHGRRLSAEDDAFDSWN